MALEQISAEVKQIRKKNAKSVFRKLIIGIGAILAVGVITYLLLLLIMTIM